MNIRIIHNNADITHELAGSATVADARDAVNARGGSAILNGGGATDTTQLRDGDFLVFVGTEPTDTPDSPATGTEPAPQAAPEPATHTFKVGPVGVRPQEVTIEAPFTAERAVEAAGYDWDDWRPSTTSASLTRDSLLVNADGSVRIDRILLGKAIEGNV